MILANLVQNVTESLRNLRCLVDTAHDRSASDFFRDCHLSARWTGLSTRSIHVADGAKLLESVSAVGILTLVVIRRHRLHSKVYVNVLFLWLSLSQGKISPRIEPSVVWERFLDFRFRAWLLLDFRFSLGVSLLLWCVCRFGN